MTKLPGKTTADINAANKAFWDERQTSIDAKLKTLRDAQVAMIDAITALAEDEAFGADQASMQAVKEIATAPLDALRVAMAHRQSKAGRARHTKKTPTVRTVTIAAMRRARSQGETLRDFLEASTICSDGIDIQCEAQHGVERFVVSADEFVDALKVAQSTLEGWWRTAAKPMTMS